MGGGKIRKCLCHKFLEKSGKNISIGLGSRIHKSTHLGENSGIGRNNEIQPGVTIGDNVMMGPDVYILTQCHEFGDITLPINRQGFRPEEPVVIENDCWIGARTVILPGVTVCEGVVVGACSVVTKSLPPYCVAAGNPAKVIKYRSEQNKNA